MKTKQDFHNCQADRERSLESSLAFLVFPPSRLRFLSCCHCDGHKNKSICKFSSSLQAEQDEAMLRLLRSAKNSLGDTVKDSGQAITISSQRQRRGEAKVSATLTKCDKLRNYFSQKMFLAGTSCVSRCCLRADEPRLISRRRRRRQQDAD